MSPKREEYHLLAAYWELVSETADGYALEQAQQQRQHYLRLLGMIATDRTSSDKELDL